jgi:hypothetical protein
VNTPSPMVAIAISSFNGDLAVLQRVQEASRHLLSSGPVAVIDSGDPVLCATLRESLAGTEPDVRYLWYPGNLGSAGNLVKRAQWAASIGADLMLAVNADGLINEDHLDEMKLLFVADEVASVFPTFIHDGGKVDRSFRHSVPVMPSRAQYSEADRFLPAERVRWGSSNGALYRVRSLSSVDLRSLALLWYGWEDLALGVMFDQVGWRQLRCRTAVQASRSDERLWSWANMTVSDKPPWVAYYSVRNLLLLCRANPSLGHRFVARIVREFIAILFRPDRWQRLREASAGFFDGLIGRAGQRSP